MSLHCKNLQIFHTLSVLILFGKAHFIQSGHIWFFHTYLEVLTLQFVAKVLIFSKNGMSKANLLKLLFGEL